MRNKDLLNRIYKPVEKKREELVKELSSRGFSAECGFFSGHFNMSENGKLEQNNFPIPVISVKGFCDIEINFDTVSVSVRLDRETALLYPFERVAQYSFEAYGTENYLTDYYRMGDTFDQMREAIRGSDEKVIGFSFFFEFGADAGAVCDCVKLLADEGFYY